jgi:hypothetical protein
VVLIFTKFEFYLEVNDIGQRPQALLMHVQSALHLNSILAHEMFLRAPMLLGALRHLQHIHQAGGQELRDQRAPMQ